MLNWCIPKRIGGPVSFIQSHWDCLGSIDFTTIAVWTTVGLVTYYLLFVMRVATRTVHFAGYTVHPTGEWIVQMGRNLRAWQTRSCCPATKWGRIG
jgi:hypothetical protein